MAPTDEDQTFFNSWDFVSMHTLKIELGISSEMAVHDQSFKVKNETGLPPYSSAHAIIHIAKCIHSHTDSRFIGVVCTLCTHLQDSET